jgi:tetratricopeptide (TPR) repeat protein
VSDNAVTLRDEIALVRRSLDDARAEHARGELDDDAFDAIERRDAARLALALERLDAAGAPDADAPDVTPRTGGAPAVSRRSRRLVVACTVALALAAGTIGVVLGRPFAGSTPALRLTTLEQVAVLRIQGEMFVATGQNARALTTFDAVLKLEPRNPEAFIESGWLHYEAGLAARRPGEVDLGAAMLRRAIAVDPANAASHLYFGIVLLQHDHDARAARAQVLRSAELPESPSEESTTSEVLSYLAHH